MTKKNILVTIVPALAVMLTACAQTQTRVERSFGDSARLLVEQQTLNPGAPANTTPITTMDGQYGEEVLEIHRRDTSTPDKVDTSITFNIGQ